MILGTSAYKLGYRATVFEPVTEAGWGILAGMGKPGARRSFYVNNDDAAKVMARAIAARAAAGVLPEPQPPPGSGPATTCWPTWPRCGPPGRTPPGTRPCWSGWPACGPRSTAGGSPPSSPPPCPATASRAGQIGRRIDGKTVNRRGPARADILRRRSPNVTRTGATASPAAGLLALAARPASASTPASTPNPVTGLRAIPLAGTAPHARNRPRRPFCTPTRAPLAPSSCHSPSSLSVTSRRARSGRSRACRKCGGAGRRRSPSGRAWRYCHRCHGTGARLRTGRRIWNYLRRAYRDGTR